MGEGNPEREWGRPVWRSDPPRESVRDPQKGCALFTLLVLASGPIGLVTGFGVWLYL